MKRTILIVLAAAWAAPLLAQQQGETTRVQNRYPRLRLGLDAVSAWQSLEQRNDSNSLPSLQSGFQAALGNVHANIALADSVQAYVELYIGSKHHEGEVMDREGWVRIGRLPDSWNVLGLNALLRHVDIKAGHFEVDFGNQHLVRSDNAEVQRNPLIGNHVVDPNTVEGGFEIIGAERAFHWLVGLGNGVTVEDFQPGRAYSRHAKVWVQPADSSFNVAASVYGVDQSGNPTGYPDKGSWTEMFAGNRSGSRYSGVMGGGPDAGQIFIGRGQDLLAWQLDATLRSRALRLAGLYGRVRDNELNGSSPGRLRESWSYFGAEARFDLLTDRLYAAARYSGAVTSTYKGTTIDANVNRYQLGLGFRLVPEMLFKVEYVEQRYRGLAQDYVGHPRFHGLLVEGSMAVR